MQNQINNDWKELLNNEFDKEYYKRLRDFIIEEYNNEEIFPPMEDVFNAFNYTAYKDVKVVVIGQDPYHGEGQAHGLCFSVQKGVKIPPSLRNIYKELHSDIDFSIPSHGCLTDWAKQGVLLLNTVLTVRAHNANSHRKKGWETFTDRVIELLNDRKDPIVFILWGNPAKKKKSLITGDRHYILEAAHPSPLSASRGFFDCKHFSQVNKFLSDDNQSIIDWTID